MKPQWLNVSYTPEELISRRLDKAKQVVGDLHHWVSTKPTDVKLRNHSPQFQLHVKEKFAREFLADVRYARSELFAMEQMLQGYVGDVPLSDDFFASFDAMDEGKERRGREQLKSMGMWDVGDEEDLRVKTEDIRR